MSLSFGDIDAAAAEEIRALRLQEGSELSEFSLAYMRHWSGDVYRIAFATVAGCGVLRFTYNGRVYYAPPFGPGDHAAALQALPAMRTMGLLTREEADRAAAGGALVFPSGDGVDYVYRQADLAALKGSHYQAKRNFCHRFEAAGDWTYGPLAAADALQVLEAWARGRDLDDEARAEVHAIREDLPDATFGGVLYQLGRPVAFAMGERLTPDMLLVAYEKADPSVVGAYAMVNREFARREGRGHTWLNRASADGHPNLVKAKESYFPARRLEKFLAFEPGLPDGAHLRRAASGDAPALTVLWQEVFGDTAAYIEGVLAKSVSFVIETGRGIVAMAHVFDHEGVKYLYAVATDPACRGRGYASALVCAAQTAFIAETLALVPGERALVAWYRRLGFAVTSESPHVTMTLPAQPGFRIEDPLM